MNGLNFTSNSIFEYEKVQCFDTVQDMKNSDNLKIGMICHTNGFHSAGDGGAAWYEIDDGVANEMDIIRCGTTCAKLIIDQNYNVKQFGAYGDNIHDDSDIINYVISITPIHGTIYLPLATYKVSQTLNIEKPVIFKGDYTGYDLEEYNDNYTIEQFQSCLIYTTAKVGVRVASPGIELRNISINSSNDEDDSIVVKISSEGTGSRYSPSMRSLVFDNCQFIGLGVNYVLSAEISLIVSSFNVVRTIGGNIGFKLGSATSVSTSLSFKSCFSFGAKTCGWFCYNLSYCSFLSCACDGFKGAGIVSQTRAYQIDHCDNLSLLSCGGEASTEETMLIQTSNCILVELTSSLAGKSYGAIYMNYANDITLMNCINKTFTNQDNEISIKARYSSFVAINCKNMGKISYQGRIENLADTFRRGGYDQGTLSVVSGATLIISYITCLGLNRYYSLRFTATTARPVLKFSSWQDGETYVPVGDTLAKIDSAGEITFISDLELKTYSMCIPLS